MAAYRRSTLNRGDCRFDCRLLCTGNYVRTSVPTTSALSNSNIFYQNFMKLGHIVKYHDVFFKFDNGPYRTRLPRVMALCL